MWHRIARDLGSFGTVPQEERVASDVAVRVHQAFGTFHRDCDRHGIENIIVVCHGTTARAFVMQWLHLTPEWFLEEPNPKNGSVRLIKGGVDEGYIFVPDVHWMAG